MTNREHVSSQALDLLLLSSLPDDERDALLGHVARCESCRGRLREREEDRQRFERAVLPRTLPVVRDRLSGSKTRGLLWRAFVPVGFAAGAALLMILLVRPAALWRTDDPYVGVRGAGAQAVGRPGRPGLEVVVQRAGAQLWLKPGDALRPGDRLRFVLEPGEASYALILGRDGTGAVSAYYPFGGHESAKAPRGRRALDGAIELDAASGSEELFVLLSDRPVRVAAAKRALEEATLDRAGQALGATVLRYQFPKEPSS